MSGAKHRRISASPLDGIPAVDLFAGAGGATTGAVRAGLRVVAAVNHWDLAVQTHKANHPDVIHRCQDVKLIDPLSLPYFRVLLASPSCVGHAKCRGKERPHHDAERSTAWCVVEIAELTLPEWIVVENVTEFLRWQFFDLWTEALKRLGYRYTINHLNAITHGLPMNRPRVFLVFRRHKQAPKIEPLKLAHVPAWTIIDLDDGEWSPIEVRNDGRARAPATLRKIRATIEQFGDEPFTLPYYGATKVGRPLDRPVGSLTTKDRHGVVKQDARGRWVMRMLSIKEQKRAMGLGDDYILVGEYHDQVKLIGNCVAPHVEENVIRQILAVA